MEKDEKIQLVSEIQEQFENLHSNVETGPEGLMVRGLMKSTGALIVYYGRFYPDDTMTILKKE